MVDSSSADGLTLLPTWRYGAITIAINWLPGVVAAIHIIAMYRHHFKASKIIRSAGMPLFNPFLHFCRNKFSVTC